MAPEPTRIVDGNKIGSNVTIVINPGAIVNFTVVGNERLPQTINANEWHKHPLLLTVVSSVLAVIVAGLIYSFGWN